MLQSSRLLGGVLVGGKSKRMGTAKAMLRCGRTTIIEHIVELLRGVCEECVLLGDCEVRPVGLDSMITLPDLHSGDGPIGGLRSLLEHHSDGWSLLVGCDLPLLSVETLQTLIAHPRGDASVVAFRIDDRLETCCALYHGRLLPVVERALRDGALRLQHLVRSAPHVSIIPDVATSQSLANVNTPDDYERLRG